MQHDIRIHPPQDDADINDLLDALAAILARLAREMDREAVQSSSQPLIEHAV